MKKKLIEATLLSLIATVGLSAAANPLDYRADMEFLKGYQTLVAHEGMQNAELTLLTDGKNVDGFEIISPDDSRYFCGKNICICTSNDPENPEVGVPCVGEGDKISDHYNNAEGIEFTNSAGHRVIVVTDCETGKQRIYSMHRTKDNCCNMVDELKCWSELDEDWDLWQKTLYEADIQKNVFTSLGMVTEWKDVHPLGLSGNSNDRAEMRAGVLPGLHTIILQEEINDQNYYLMLNPCCGGGFQLVATDACEGMPCIYFDENKETPNEVDAIIGNFCGLGRLTLTNEPMGGTSSGVRNIFMVGQQQFLGVKSALLEDANDAFGEMMDECCFCYDRNRRYSPH